MEGKTIGFLHDSLIDYFAGAAGLGEYNGPDEPPPCRSAEGPSHIRKLPDQWFRAVTILFRSDPVRWDKAAGFLAGTLTCGELRDLLKAFLIEDADLAWVQLFVHVLQGRPTLPDAVADAIERAILRRGSWVRSDPSTLTEIICDDLMGDLPRLHGQDGIPGRSPPELLPAVSPSRAECDAFVVDNLLPHLQHRGQPWLRRAFGLAGPPVFTMAEHTDAVNCVAALRGCRVASGSIDGTVKVWDPKSGKVQTIDTHAGQVRCVASMHDGRVACGVHITPGWPITARADDWGTQAIVWDPETDDIRTLIKSKSEIDCLVTLRNGMVVFGHRGLIQWFATFWKPDTGDHQSMEFGTCESVLPMNFGMNISVLPIDFRMSGSVLRDGRIVFRDADRSVMIWDAFTGESHVMNGKGLGVRHVAELRDGRIVLVTEQLARAQEAIATVILWDPATDEVRNIAEQAAHITSLTTLRSRRIVWGDEAGVVTLWDPVGGNFQTMCEHKSRVTSLVPARRGRIASADSSGVLKLWNPATGEVQTMAEHTDSISSLAVLPDGRIVSGSSDRTVKLWDPAYGDGDSYGEQVQAVRSLAVMCDGRIVSGHSRGLVKLSDPVTGDVQIMSKHTHAVTSVLTIGDGEVLSLSEYRQVELWKPSTNEVCTISDRTSAVARLSDGRVVLGEDRERQWPKTEGKRGVASQKVPDTSGFGTEGTSESPVLANNGVGSRIPAIEKSPQETLEAPAALPPATGRRTLRASFMAAVLGEFSATGCLPLLLGRTIGVARVWDPATGALQTLAESGERVNLVAALRDGRILFGSSGGLLEDNPWFVLWDPSTRSEQPMSTIETNPVYRWSHIECVAETPDGRLILAGIGCRPDDSRLWGRLSGAARIALWNPATGDTEDMVAEREHITCLAVTGDGRIVSGCRWSDKLSLWDPSARTVESFGSHPGVVTCLTPYRATRVVSGGADGTVKVWDTTRKALVCQYRGEAAVECMASYPAASGIVVGFANGRVLVLTLENDPA